jgi:hypothetical protein
MKFTKTLFLLTVVFVLAMSGLAFAVNTATINVTSEPIRQFATCDKAGGFTITFDKTTMLKDGDQITADLDIGATLCRDIDIVIARGAGAIPGNPSGQNVGWDETTPNEGSPVTINNADEDAGNDFTSTNGGVFFWVHGTEGLSRIIVDVIGENEDGVGVRGTASAGSITVGDDDGDTLSIQFLDQKVNGSIDIDDGYTVEGIWVDNNAGGNSDGIYGTHAQLGQNTLCINVSALPSNVTKVNANCDSKQDKFTFIPSNPQVAHVVTAMGFRLAPCKYATPGAIIIGAKSVPQGPGATCTAFDNESGSGYCSGTHGNNQIIIESIDGPFEMTEYQIRMELLKNNAIAKSDGVYWSNAPVMVGGYDSQPCDADNTDGFMITGSNSYWSWESESAGYVACTAESPNSADCDVTRDATVNNEAVRILTSSSTLALNPTNRFLYVNLPPINYDLDQISSGDSVSVRITVLKTPCGELFTGTVELGVFGCAQIKPVYSLVYPYFTDDGGAWWNGLAITNLGVTDGSATIYFHETDGDEGQVTVTVKAGAIFADLKENILALPGMVTTPAGAVLGDSRAYAVVCTDFNVDGFVMLGNYQTGEGQGYVPRIPDGMPIDCSN